jgi:hypothetical protein
MNSHINNNTTTPNYLRILQTLPSYTNGNFTYLDNNYAYIIFNSNSSIQFKEDTPCELLIVGAGGRGGAFSTFGGAGGGGCGQIIYNPSLTFQSNSYDIIIGVDSADSNKRISKIVSNNQEIISAIGGGDGAYWDGLSFGEIQRYPPQIFTSNSPIITTTFLNNPCYKSTIYVNSNSYDIFYSSRKDNSSFDAINLFNCLEPSSNNEAVFLNNQYNNSQKFNYKQSNYLVDFTYKGDWICIKLPIPILLTSYSFFQNTTEISGAPNNFKIYGSVNGIDWDIVKERNSLVNLSVSYLNYKYTETLSPLPTKPYLYYGLVVNSLIGSLTYLNFNEWVLNGKPIIITSSTINGGSSIFNLPSNQIQGGFGGSFINQKLIKTIKENSSINIPYDNHIFKINRNPLNTYINSGTYSAIFNEGFITFANETYLSFPILTSIEPEYWYKFNSSSGFNNNLIISGNITKNLNDIYFDYGAYLTPTINQLWNSNGISFSFWIKPVNDTGDNIWIFKTIENPNEFISFHKNEFKISNNGLITSVNFNINILDGLYHHFICSINPSGRIFVACDGIIYENSSINPFINKSYKNGRIGEFFQGSMKDFRIYLKVLNIEEIQELFKGRIEIFYNRFNEIITTTNIQIGSGGIGGTSSSIPTIKNYYGDGGDGNRDGNLGLGFQGIVIIKYPYPYFKTTLTPYKFPNSQFLKFSGLNNPDGIAFKLLENKNDNRILSINDLNFNFTSNNHYIESTSNINFNNSLFINSNNTIGFGTNIGINNSFSINDFTIQKNNSNISFNNPSGFFGIGTTKPLNFLDIRNNVFMSKLNINSLEIKIINSNKKSLIIPENSRIFFNYTNETKINSGIYDINFTDGSIICSYLNPDKSYPILKEPVRYNTEEREYPPKLYDSISTETTTNDILEKITYKQILTLNNSNITYGSGDYIIYSSSKLTSNTITKSLLFNKDFNDSINEDLWNTNNYENITGNYIGNNFIKNNYLGDWIILKLPIPIILTKFKFYTSQDVKSPSLWRCYGSIDGITFTEIIEASNDINGLTITNYSNGYYEKTLNINILYMYIGFTFNKIIGGTSLNFKELVLYGNEKLEEITIILDPFIWYKFDDETNLEKDELNSFNLVSVNNPTFNSTIFNKGIGCISLLRQNNQYLILNGLNFNDLSYTISLWSYLLSYDSNFTPLFHKGTENENFIIAYNSNRNIVFGFNDNNLSAGNFPNDINIWINWIFTYDKDTKKRIIYRNGLKIAEDFSSSFYTPITHIYNIGRLNKNNIENYFDGYIDDFRIYNKVLNSNQVQELYKGRIEINSYLNTNSNLNIFGNASISGDANIENLILNGVIYKNNGIPYIDSGWTTMSEANSNIFNSYSVVGIGTTFPRFQNRLDVNGSIICNEVYVNGSLLTSDFIKNSGTNAETIAFGTLRKSSGGTGFNSFAPNQILNSTIIWSNNSLNILGNVNNSNIGNERIVLNNGIRIGNVLIDKYGISNSHINSNIIIGNSNKFLIRSNIGIGTTNPINTLDIYGNMRITRVLGVSNISNNEILNGVVMNVSNISIEKSGVINKYLSRWGNSNNFMGFVGIGTTNPRNSLDIIGNLGIKGVLNVSNISNNEIFNGITMNVSNINIENSVINYKNNSNFIGSRWNLSNSSIFYNSGSVGIRTNDLDSKFNINGNVNMKGSLDMNNSNISNIDIFSGKTLKINNLQFLTNSSANINFINGNTLNLNNWTTINDTNSIKYVQTFSYTGGIQTFNIPFGVNSINIYCWGAGGGSSSNYSIPSVGGYGGNGGFVSATLDILSSITSLKIIVGQGGKKGVRSGNSSRSYGGGGYGLATDVNWALGGGGGLSGVFIDNANISVDANGIVNTNAIPILIGGGGGGAGATSNTYNGGNAGGTTGNSGNGDTSTPGGTGGTQTEGGTGSGSGSKYNGGVGGSFGGGGGAGWFGGGAGNITAGNVASGGGGSSYLNTLGYNLSNINIPNAQTNGTRTAQGNTNMYYQSGIALGADRPLIDGGNGLVVIEYYISKAYYNYGNVGIRTSSNQSNTIDINGDLNFNSNISNLNNQIFNFENYNGLITTNPVVNITNNPTINSYGYYQFVIANTITFNRDLLCDVLVVGAGGNGGVTAGSGGGGGGEVIYQPNYLFQKGSYNLSVGTSSTSTGNRISKITRETTEIFKALGGDDGNILNNSVTITGTGNSINIASDNPNYKYAFFANTGTFIIDNDLICDILIVGGGGGGSRNDAWEGGGGGGAGGVGIGSIYLKKGIIYNITIGNGGGASANGSNTTIIGGLINETAYGGGGGLWDGNSGGSGAGASGNGGNRSGGAATRGLSSSGINSSIIYYGNNGGNGNWDAIGGGGGGANDAGNVNGNGGNGKEISITGISTYYGGGGGGAVSRNGGTRGSGGLGGGGYGGSRGSPAAGIINTGGGGGGSSGSDGASGGSGVVIIRYLFNSYTSGGNQLISKNSSIMMRNTSLLVNYTNNIFLSSGSYDIDFNNGFIGIGETPYIKPWGAYFANDWSGTTLLDSSGNGRHATTSSGNITKTSDIGNGATGVITYISGGTSATITFPTGSIPTNFTILTLTRYSGSTKGRIVVSTGSGNWLHGHYAGNRGVCHYDSWKTANSNRGTNTDWVCCIGKNGGATPNNILADGVAIGTEIGGNGSYTLGVNNYQYGETSDWALSAVIIYNSHLTNYHMNKLNDFINTYKSSGNLAELKSNILRNIDNSYPILKGGEKRYPPKLYDSSTGESTNTSELTGISPATYYKGTITINSYSNGYGIGTYIIYSSSYYTNGAEKKLLFDFNNGDGNTHWATSGTYSTPYGFYVGSSYIKPDYKGDWIVLKLPNSIILNRFKFYSRSSIVSRCPGLWKCYGSNDGITFTEILEASNTAISLTSSSYSSGFYEQIFTTFSISYLYICFTFNKLVGVDDNAYCLNFSEIQLFAKDDIIINPILWYKFDGASTFLNDNINVSNNLTNYGTTFDNTTLIKGNGSIKFVNSSSQYAIIPNNLNWSAINALNGISFSWWAKNNSSSGSWARLWDFGIKNTNNSAVGSRYIMVSKYANETNHRFELTNTGENGSGGTSYSYDTSGTNYFDGNWRHYVWTISSSGIWNIYINNSNLLHNSQKIAIPTMTQANLINNFGRSLFTNDGYYDGNIDDFRIYDQELTPSHVQELYNGRIDINHSPLQNTIIKYSSGGSGGGSFYNSNNQSYVLSKWNNIYSYISSGNNGTNFIGGKGGSSLIKSTYNLTGTNQIIGIGGLGATSASASGVSKSFGCGGDGNGGSGGSGIIIIKILKEIRNFNLVRNYLFNNGTDYSILNGERQYPPKIWDTIDSSITNITYNGLISYKINYNITTSRYGNGSYSVYYSNKFMIEGTYYYSPANNLFDYSLENVGNFLDTSITGYNSSSYYIGDRYLAEQSFKGEWFFIKLPIQIMITRYIIISLPNYVHRCPALWKIYGSNDGINWEEIIQASNSITKLTLLDYTNKSYSKILNTPSKFYNHIGMCVNAIILNSELMFSEFQIFGIEKNSDNNINPTAWYKFDNPNNIGFDSSGNGYHLTNNGSVSAVSGVKGTFASSFNGTNYLLNTNGINFNEKSFSISYWQYAKWNYNSFTCSFGDNYNLISNNSLMVGYGANLTGKYFFGFWANDYYSPEFPNDINNWVFLTFTYNYLTSLRKIYRNGVYIGGDTSPSQLSLNGNSICIGRILNVDGYSTNGYLDDFRIYNGIELTQSQINELYENSRINFIINGNSISKGTNYISSPNNYPLLTYANNNIINPIIWYKFDDSTNLGKDEMNNHNLTNNNSVSYNSSSFIKGTGSGNFNGTNQYLNKTSAFNLNSNDFSICFWINRTTNGRHDEIIIIGSSMTSSQLIDIAIYNTNQIAFNWWLQDFVSDNSYSDAGTWVHLCFTYKAGIKIKTIYRNGVIIKSGSIINEVSTTNDIRIGADINSRFFSGLLDDFRIYDFELSPNQVQELYNTTNNYTTLINYPTNYFSSYSSNFNNPFIRTSNNNLELLSYTNNNINSLLLESNIKLITNDNNRLTFNSNIISINNSLDIKGNSGNITNQGGAYFTTNIASSSYSNGYIPEYTRFSLKTFDNIICGKNSYALSDIRIKKNVSNIDDISSLEKILRVEPKIYGYIDNIQRTNSNVYGFIAQQIRDILPEATELTTKFIPDIFKLVKINENRINLNEEELKKIEIGDILEIYTKDNTYDVKVIKKDNDGIEIDMNIKDNDIFIYGRQVKDFHIIDKSYLYTLNICATQELARIVEGLKERINSL